MCQNFPNISNSEKVTTWQMIPYEMLFLMEKIHSKEPTFFIDNAIKFFSPAIILKMFVQMRPGERTSF